MTLFYQEIFLFYVMDEQMNGIILIKHLMRERFPIDTLFRAMVKLR